MCWINENRIVLCTVKYILICIYIHNSRSSYCSFKCLGSTPYHLYHPEIELCASPMATGPRARLFMWNRYSNLATLASDVLFDVGWLDGVGMASNGMAWVWEMIWMFFPHWQMEFWKLVIMIWPEIDLCFLFCRALTVSVRELAQSRFPRLQPANCSLQLQKEGKFRSVTEDCRPTVDGRNPAPPGMYKTLWIMGKTTNLNWCRISPSTVWIRYTLYISTS